MVFSLYLIIHTRYRYVSKSPLAIAITLFLTTPRVQNTETEVPRVGMVRELPGPENGK
jgi:hypothetical protein